MRSVIRVGLVITLATVWASGASAQEALTKSDRRGPVSVTVTLAAPPTIGAPIKAKVVLDTHSVGLDGIAFDSAVALWGADGGEVAPTAVQATGSGHHREAVLEFPAPAAPGKVRIVVKNVGGVAERSFEWEAQPAR